MSFENIHTAYRAPAADLPPTRELADAVRAGATFEELAERYGCSSSTIQSRVAKSGYLAVKPTRIPAAEADMVAADDPIMPVLPMAACRETSNPDAFFSHNAWEVEAAREYCRRCPEIRACLTWALTHDESGMWAGTTAEQRTDLIARHTRSPA